MASQVVEQLSQLESLCERLYLSQVGVSLINAREIMRSNVKMASLKRRTTKNGIELNSTSEYLASPRSPSPCAR